VEELIDKLLIDLTPDDAVPKPLAVKKKRENESNERKSKRAMN